jgi:predicted nucleic-acid-binding Zn-ribbon protein
MERKVGIILQKNGCIKCGSRNAATKEVAMSGTGLSKMFDIQHNHFIVVYCKSCGYSEFYNKQSSTASNILDLFFGG